MTVSYLALYNTANIYQIAGTEEKRREEKTMIHPPDNQLLAVRCRFDSSTRLKQTSPFHTGNILTNDSCPTFVFLYLSQNNIL